MKLKILIPFAIIAAIISAGCSKLTEAPLASLTPGTYFKSEADLDASVTAMYQDMVQDGAYAFDYPTYPYFGADDLTTNPANGKSSQPEWDQLNASPSNGQINSDWQTPWTAIRNANVVTDNYQRIPASAARNNAVGDALFVRAWNYFILVRTYGPLPVIVTAEPATYRPQRDPVDKVYAQIVSDLQAAIAILPTFGAPSPAIQPGVGHATQNAARTLLAEVYLTMATWPLNQTSNYALAAAESDSVMSSGQYSLVPDYLQVFETNDNSESVFSLHFNVAGGAPNRLFGDCAGDWDEVGQDGNFGWEEFYPELNFFLAATPCTRTNEEFYTQIKLIRPDKVTFDVVPYNSTRCVAALQHPQYRKFRPGLVVGGVATGINETDSTIISMNPSTDKTTDIFRYPMALLCYAEASDMAGGGPTAAGYAALNLVRARAGEAPMVAGLSQTAFRDTVVFERAYEFAAEYGMRWYDIQRLQLLPQVVAARSPLELAIPASSMAVLQTRYYSPIPLNEMLVNPTWAQNPGY
jgi:hypothetical protein